MIIAHFFLRKVRRQPRLFVETTSSNGLEQPAPAAIDLMPVDMSSDRNKWMRDAYYEFTRRFPDLVLKDSMDNYLRLESDHPSFDMVFKPRRKTRKKEPVNEEARKDEATDEAEEPEED